MPEGSSTPEIKISHSPQVQSRVEEKKATILQKHPNAEESLVNEQARSRVASELRIERLRKEGGRSQKKSITDSLTGALNNTGFEEIMQLEGRRTLRTGKPMVIAILDANDLKEKNKAGHKAGDEYLRAIAGVLKKTGRSSDILGRQSNSEQDEESPNVARWGGDEFGVILEETDVEGAKVWWKRTSEEFQNEGISIGVGIQALYPSELAGKTPAEVSAIIGDRKHEADLALMGIAKPESKQTNQPSIAVYSELPDEIKATLPQRIAALNKVA